MTAAATPSATVATPAAWIDRLRRVATKCARRERTRPEIRVLSSSSVSRSFVALVAQPRDLLPELV
jgi:hypothetical protein